MSSWTKIWKSCEEKMYRIVLKRKSSRSPPLVTVLQPSGNHGTCAIKSVPLSPAHPEVIDKETRLFGYHRNPGNSLALFDGDERLQERKPGNPRPRAVNGVRLAHCAASWIWSSSISALQPLQCRRFLEQGQPNPSHQPCPHMYIYSRPFPNLRSAAALWSLLTALP